MTGIKIPLNDRVDIDLGILLDTRLLIQSNSGGGKSWLIRRILEHSHGKVQQIILDIEGEFSTLREKYDYILAAKEGDTAAEPRSAALLAKRLLELNVSAIIDLYELSHQERKHFARLFLSAMINAPESLWHPCLVIIDEAHVFCPQVGQSEAMESVIDIATRGRKRGYCAVLATQRLSKLHKDAVAEMNNKLIGRTGLDIDRKSAAEELGFTSKEDSLSLRNLAPGEFYAFGPAISEAVEKVTVGPVATSHPKAGARILTKVTPPTAKIRSIIAKLADLPQEAQQEAQNLDALKSENANLKRRITQFEMQQPVARPKVVTIEKSVEVIPPHIIKKVADYMRDIEKITSAVDHLFAEALTDETAKFEQIRTRVKAGDINDRAAAFAASINVAKKPIVGGALRMLQVLASRYPMTFTKSQLALLANLSPKSGTYGTYLSLLRSQELIEVGAEISITDEGLHYIGTEKPQPQSQEEILEMWENNLTGGARRMFNVLVGAYPIEVNKEDLGKLTEMSSSSGTFGTYLSLLRRNGLVEVAGSSVKASPNLFVASAYKQAKEEKR